MIKGETFAISLNMLEIMLFIQGVTASRKRNIKFHTKMLLV